MNENNMKVDTKTQKIETTVHGFHTWGVLPCVCKVQLYFISSQSPDALSFDKNPIQKRFKNNRKRCCRLDDLKVGKRHRAPAGAAGLLAGFFLFSVCFCSSFLGHGKKVPSRCLITSSYWC